jgi:transposase-like protein
MRPTLAGPKVITAAQEQEIARLLLDPRNRVVDIARRVGVSRATVYRRNNPDLGRRPGKLQLAHRDSA